MHEFLLDFPQVFRDSGCRNLEVRPDLGGVYLLGQVLVPVPHGACGDLSLAGREVRSSVNIPRLALLWKQL